VSRDCHSPESPLLGKLGPAGLSAGVWTWGVLAFSPLLLSGFQRMAWKKDGKGNFSLEVALNLESQDLPLKFSFKS
jgi:hypothetical protein